MTIHPLQILLARKWWNSIPSKKRIHLVKVMKLNNSSAIAAYWMRQIASKQEADSILQALKEQHGTH